MWMVGMTQMAQCITASGILCLIIARHTAPLIQILGTQPKKHVAHVEGVAFSVISLRLVQLQPVQQLAKYLQQLQLKNRVKYQLGLQLIDQV